MDGGGTAARAKCCRPIARSNQPGERISFSRISNQNRNERIKYENAVLSINNLFRKSGGPREGASGLLRHMGAEPGKEQEHRTDGATEDAGHAPPIRFSAGYKCA